MTANFKDHFSGHSADYRTYRPTYPEAMYEYLSSLCAEHHCAWDCATGNGQAAIGLAKYFDEVIATDASAGQIDNADGPANVEFRVASAEHSGLDNASVNLVTVAQAIHWFDLEAFKGEVERVLKPGGVLAVWLYGLLTVNAEIDAVVNHLYGPVLDDYWPPERQLIEEGYRHVSFPYERLDTPEFAMKTRWNLSQLVGYLNTWSAVKKYIERNAANPVEALLSELAIPWGDPASEHEASWPLELLVWRKPG